MNENLYKIEMHVHTSESSGCALLSAEDQVRIYKEHGYAGMVITDHFGTNTGYTAILQGYYHACEAGRKYNMKIYFGLELRLEGGPEDYLVYGASPAFLEKQADITRMTLSEVKRIADRNQVLLMQAHPFRQGLRQAAGKDVHGYAGLLERAGRDPRIRQ